MASSAPKRRAVRTESMAVLPPPITATRLPLSTGVSNVSFAAPIRFTRVRYSFDDITPIRFSPLMFMKFGRPAPDATNNPWKPSALRSSKLIVLPTMQSFINLTPIFSRLPISTSTIEFGRRNSGIPYLSTPPISCNASNTVTS